MRAVSLVAAFAVVGCIGTVEGADVPDRGGGVGGGPVAASGGGEVVAVGGGNAAMGGGAGVGGDGGGGTVVAQPDAGRVFSTNRSEFFGSPRCAAAGVTFCDDFENRSEGAAPDPASWSLEFWDQSAASVKVVGEGARGNKAMHFEIGQGTNKAMMSLKKVFPMAGNTFWARMFVRMPKRPLPFVWNDQANFPLTHWTFAYATGNHVFTSATLRPELRAGGFINRVPLMNEDGMDRTEVGIDDHPPAGHQELPENQWVCFELQWNGPDQEMRFYWDGIEHPSLHVTKTHTGGENDSNPPWPAGDPFDTLTLGLVMYQHYDKIGATIGLDIDEVAVDGRRIGCSR